MAVETTIHDIARQLDISATTVWRAINDRPRVSPSTRNRVIAEVQRLGYRPSLVAQNLSWGRTQTLGVVVPTISNPVYASLVRSAEQAAFDQDYNIVLCDTDFNLDREQQYLDLLIRRRVEGVLLVPFAKESASTDDVHLRRLTEVGITVVCMQQRLSGSHVEQVVPDNVGAARDMTRHLIRLGHRRIAFLHGGLDPWLVPMVERLEGYRAALQEAHLPESPDLIVPIGSFESMLAGREGDFYPERIASVMLRRDRPTAVFAPVDVLAIKAMGVMRNLGLRVPEDVAVVGFDDIQMTDYTEPPLTTVRHPAEEVGRRAAKLLFDRLAGDDSDHGPAIQRVPCELVIRSSCGAACQQ